MARSAKSIYVCSECGGQSPKWAGQCGDCGAWNTLQETVAATSARPESRFAGYAGDAGGVDAGVEVRQADEADAGEVSEHGAEGAQMEAVPEADVVITNPTHLAVALKFDAGQMVAPTVVAKGAGPVARPYSGGAILRRCCGRGRVDIALRCRRRQFGQGWGCRLLVIRHQPHGKHCGNGYRNHCDLVTNGDSPGFAGARFFVHRCATA